MSQNIEPAWMTIGDDPPVAKCADCGCDRDDFVYIQLTDSIVCDECFCQRLYDYCDDRRFEDALELIQEALYHNHDDYILKVIAEAIREAF